MDRVDRTVLWSGEMESLNECRRSVTGLVKTAWNVIITMGKSKNQWSIYTYIQTEDIQPSAWALCYCLQLLPSRLHKNIIPDKHTTNPELVTQHCTILYL